MLVLVLLVRVQQSDGLLEEATLAPVGAGYDAA